MTATAILFWAAIAGLAYIFAGYPLLVYAASKLRPRREAGHVDVSDLRAAVLIAAHNETDVLTAKLRQLDAEPRVAAVHVGIDGRSPEVARAAEAAGSGKVQVHRFEQRRGKPAVLSDLMTHVTQPVTIMADARQVLADGALEALVQRLADPAVGVVSGELVFRSDDATSASEGVGAYWTYEKFIRKAEANFRGVPGATGALYAIRTELLRPIAASTLLDDVVIPMQAVEQGSRCVVESAAIIYDRPSTDPGREAIRKRRTIAGAAQLVLAQPRWLLPWHNPIWWEFVSHKLARLLAPLLLLIAAVTNVVLATGSRFYLVLLVLHVGFYLAAATGYAAQKLGRRLPGLSIPLMFVTLNGTTLLALADAARGRFKATWTRSEPAA